MVNSWRVPRLKGCHQDEQRRIEGRDQSVGAAVLVERDHLLPLVKEGVDLAQTSFPSINGMGVRQGAPELLFGTVKIRNTGASENLCQ
jgi:hypothetical protein